MVAVQFGPQVVPPPGAFLQATAEGEAALVDFVRRSVAGAAQIADLYAGIGTFALPLAATAEVHAVEGLPAPLAALEAEAKDALRAKGWEPDYLTVRQRGDLLPPADARTGDLVALGAARLGTTRLIDNLEF